MPNTLRLRRGSTAPSAGSFVEGEPAWDSTNKKLYVKAADGSMVEIGAGGGGDVTLAGANAFTGANTFTNTTGQTFRRAATQDGIVLRGRAGGTGSHTVEIVPGTLTASRSITCPDGDVFLTAGTMATRNNPNTFQADNTFQGAVTLGNLCTFGNQSLTGFVSSISKTAPHQANFPAFSITSSATGGSTIAEFVQVAAQRPTLAANNASVTWTDATSFYYAGPPIAGTNAIITNAWTQYIAAGRCYFGGGINIGPEETTRYLENAANGSNYVAFKAPASIPSDVTWTLPSADATSSGQVLSSNAAGTLSWITPSGSGDVTQVGNNAFTGANTFYNTTGQTIGTGTSTEDGIILKGRAGGSTSLRVSIEPGTLTASRTLTLPDATGTVITTGDTGTVTSTMIADGTIANGDISASAAIAYSKLAALTSANILLGSATNVATSTAMSGDVTISNTGVTTIAADAVTFAKFQNITSSRLLGRTTASAGDVEELTVGAGLSLSAGSLSSDVTLTGTQTLTNKTLTDPAIIGTIIEDVFTITDGAAFEVNPSNGSIQLITLTASRTPKATNFVAGEAVTLMVDDGTAYALTWTDATWGGSGVVWKTNNAAAPTLNTTGYTVIVLWKVGTQVYGARVGDA